LGASDISSTDNLTETRYVGPVCKNILIYKIVKCCRSVKTVFFTDTYEEILTNCINGKSLSNMKELSCGMLGCVVWCTCKVIRKTDLSFPLKH
jgi:hypothetical protein